MVAISYLFKYYFIFFSKVVIGRNNHFFAGIKSFQYLIIKDILTVDTDRTFHGKRFGGIEHINPITTCFLEKSSSSNVQGIGLAAEFESLLKCLAPLDVIGITVLEKHINLK